MDSTRMLALSVYAGHVKNIHLHAVWLHIKNIHFRKTNTNPNRDSNRCRRRCPDPNARIQNKDVKLKFFHNRSANRFNRLKPVTVSICAVAYEEVAGTDKYCFARRAVFR